MARWDALFKSIDDMGQKFRKWLHSLLDKIVWGEGISLISFNVYFPVS